jgi:hypothetical protein
MGLRNPPTWRYVVAVLPRHVKRDAREGAMPLSSLDSIARKRRKPFIDRQRLSEFMRDIRSLLHQCFLLRMKKSPELVCCFQVYRGSWKTAW